MFNKGDIVACNEENEKYTVVVRKQERTSVFVGKILAIEKYELSDKRIKVGRVVDSFQSSFFKLVKEYDPVDDLLEELKRLEDNYEHTSL